MTIPRTFALALAFLTVLAASGAEPLQGDFFVAPDGNDAGPGTKAQPFATLNKAREAVRALSAPGLKKNVVVCLRGGRYELAAPVVFTPEDSGAEACSITYAAGPDETVCLSGGREIKNWKKGAGDLWTAELPDVKAGKWWFRQLFVDGERAVRARQPNTGQLLSVRSVSKDVKTIAFNAALPKESLAGQDAELVVYQNWSITRSAIVSSDEKQIVLATPSGWIGHGPMTTTSPGKPAYLEHARAFVDQPGEWYLDRREGLLTYQAAPGADLGKAKIFAPFAEQLIVLAGTKEKPVRNLRFTGLQFEHAEFPLPACGYPEIQAGHYGPATDKPTFPQPVAIECVYATDCRFELCRVTHLGGSGIGFGPGCQRNAVTGCVFEDVGGNGVMIGWRGKGKLQNFALDADWVDPTDAPAANAVTNSLFQRCGAIGHGCVGVFAAFSADTKIAHNLVREMPYTGISIGFRWNKTPTTQKNCLVELNHIHDVMKMLADGGGIYSLGWQPGTTLRGNLIHDVHRSRYAHGGAPNNGFFVDEGSKGFLFEGNVVYGTSGEPVRFNQCQRGDHTWKDNVLGARAPKQKGKTGQALACNGSSDFLEAPHAAALEPEQLSVTAWVHLTEYPGGEDNRRWVVNKNGNEWDQGHYALIVMGKEAGAYLNIGGGRQNSFEVFSTTAPLKLNQWQHLALTYDGANAVVYLDGAPVATRAINRKRAAGGGAFAIGRRADGFGNSCFKGLVDEVRVYSRALTAAQVKPEAQDPAQAAKEGLAGEWTFDEKAGEDAGQKWAAQAGLEAPYRKLLLGEKGEE
jgi:hypothetical protein